MARMEEDETQLPCEDSPELCQLTTSHSMIAVPAAEDTNAEGEGTSERPRKRRKEKYQAFEREEKDWLNYYENLESKTRKIVNKTYEKLFDVLSRGTMPDGINYLKERLETLKEKTSLDPIYIGFLGQTGAGKSSLLNAMIGRELFLPVSGMRACTSCIVHVKRSKSDCCEATIHLLSEQEWKDEMQNLVKVLSEDEDSSSTSDDSVSEATKKLCALYGSGAQNKSYEKLLKTKLQVNIPSRRIIQIKEKEPEEFSKKLIPFIRDKKKKKGTNEDFNKDSEALWPLIKHVEVTIPGSDVLPEGITFVDIPGTGDFNKKRDEMWKQAIDKCSVIWIVSEIKRIVGEKDQETLLNASIKAYLAGKCTDITIVGTKSDDLKLEEYMSERADTNPPIENIHDAIIERNKEVKNEKGADLREKLKKRLPSSSELICKSDLVYTVSATDFWKGQHLSKEETEIPNLRESIRRAYLQEKRKLVTDYVTEALGIHLLAENFGSEQHLVEQYFQESGVEQNMNEKIDALGENLERCFHEIEQPLCDGVEHAKRSYRKIVEKMLTRENGYQGFHRTLKAVCLNNGMYTSRMFARIDFNEDLARPIYDKIEDIFGGIFRIQTTSESSLWFYLKRVMKWMQKMIHQIGIDNQLADSSPKIKMCIHETCIILKKLEKEISQRKTVIYGTLLVSIQNVLRPHYEAASKIKGLRSCEKMKTLLRDNIDMEVRCEMFEKAKSKMESGFLELKEEIVKMLKKEISIVFKLVLLQQEELALKLPEIENECREIGRIHSMLQSLDQHRKSI